ncbi:MAG: bifunctional folylpolyglutamate synthase/dihydrofolate synthase [Lachnospiraceae bacterium]|nr:bifunctional folylpolyglutamate synthase/dihydrofolate synthase [Lachnospiraceae bacterium]
MTYEEARAFLDSCNQYAGEFTLEPLRAMLEKLGNPERQLSFVHIAGTNGKGSVLAFVSTALKEAGYRVGRYISPTIFSYRERIQVNEEYISREDLTLLAERIRAAGEELLAEGKRHPTTFEAETALALLWFAEQSCDLVVLEVGRGGLTDATNVIENTLVAALASISMDHMDFLGSTLGAIAEQKAGIIKQGCTVVSAAQQPEAAKVIEKKAVAFGVPLIRVQPDEIRNRRRGLLRQSFDYRERADVEISLCGEYQFENAALALEVLDALRGKDYEIPEAGIRRGFQNTVWRGRFSVLSEKPLFLMDGAHNRDAAARLRECIENYLPGRRLIFIIGVLKDKEYGELLRQTAPLAAEILTITPPDNPRALPAVELAREAEKYCSDVRAAESIREAVDTALSLVGEEDVILAFGSLSWLGELAGSVKERTIL